MPNVNIDLSELSGIDPGIDNLKNATAWLYPYRPYEDGGSLVTTDKLVVSLTSGVGSTFLPETPDANGMWVEIRGVRLPSDSRKFVVAIPGTDCNLFDLDHLDPDSLDPTAPLSPAWVADLAAAVALLEPKADLDDDTGALVADPASATAVAVAAKITELAGRVLVAENGDGTVTVTASGGGFTLTDNGDGTADITLDGQTVTVGGGEVDSINGQTGTVVLDADDIADGTTNHAFTAADDTKLASIATNATSNQSDATTIAAIAAAQTAAQTASQPRDTDLTTIAALTATTDNVIQSVAGAWASRTMAQLKTALALVKGDVGLANADNLPMSSVRGLDFLSTVGDVGAYNLAILNSGSLGTANTATFVEIVPKKDITVAKLSWYSGAVSAGNYDIGIFDASGARLWSKGSAAYPAISTRTNETVSPTVALTAGTRYYIAFTQSDITATWRGIVPAFPVQAVKTDGTSVAFTLATALPLPSSATLSSTSGIRYPAISIHAA